MIIKKILVLCTTLCPVVLFGQFIPKPNAIQLSFSPGLGHLSFANPLSLNQTLPNKSNQLIRAPFPNYRGTYGSHQTIQQYRPGLLAFHNIQLLLGWEQLTSGKAISRFELGLSYQRMPGRRSFYTNTNVSSLVFQSDTTLQNYFYSYEENFDLAELVTRYQVRISPEESKNGLFIGVSARVGTEFLKREIEATLTNYHFEVLPERNIFYYSERQFKLQSRRGGYLSFLIPISYERSLTKHWQVNSSLSMGWGMVAYRPFSLRRYERYSTAFVDIGLRYRI